MGGGGGGSVYLCCTYVCLLFDEFLLRLTLCVQIWIYLNSVYWIASIFDMYRVSKNKCPLSQYMALLHQFLR